MWSKCKIQEKEPNEMIKRNNLFSIRVTERHSVSKKSK